MSQFFRIANWGAIQGETGPATVQAMRRLVGAAGGGGAAGGLNTLDSFNNPNPNPNPPPGNPGGFEFKIPLILIGKPPPQLIIGWNLARVWHHSVQENGEYQIRSQNDSTFVLKPSAAQTVDYFAIRDSANSDLFEVNLSGYLGSNNPAALGAWLTQRNAAPTETEILAIGPSIWIDANDPLGDGTLPSSISDDTDINDLTGGGWADKGTRVNKVTSSNATNAMPAWFKTAGASPKAVSLPNGKPYVSTIPGGVGTSNDISPTFQLTDVTIYAIHYVPLDNGSAITHVGGEVGIDAGYSPTFFSSQDAGANNPSLIKLRDNAEPLDYEVVYDQATTQAAGWKRTMFRREGSAWTHKMNDDEIAEASSQNPSQPAWLNEYFQRSDNDGASITRSEGWWAELLIFDSALSTADQATVESYLDNKWATGSGGGGASVPFYHMKNSANTVLSEFNALGYLHIGGESPLVPLQVTNTGEQLRLNYDASNKTTFTVGSTGSLIIASDAAMQINTLSGDLSFNPSGDDVNVVGSASLNILSDSAFLRLGAGKDATIKFDGSDLVFTTTAATEDFVFQGTLGSIKVRGYGSNLEFTRAAQNYFEATSTGGHFIFRVNNDPANHAFRINADKSIALPQDSQLLLFGAGSDSSITFDGSHMVITPDRSSNVSRLEIVDRVYIESSNTSNPILTLAQTSASAPPMTILDHAAAQMFNITAAGVWNGPDHTDPWNFESFSDDFEFTPKACFQFTQNAASGATGNFVEWITGASATVLTLALDGELQKDDDPADRYLHEQGGGYTLSNPLDLNGVEIQFDEQTAPGTPATDHAVVYLDSGTGVLTIKKDSGSAVSLEAGGGGGSPLTTKGDVFGFTTVDARIPVGTDTHVLTANSAVALGVEWAVAPGGTPLTTKGDLFTYDTDVQRLAIGTDTHVLTADSAQPTGMKWAAAGAGGAGWDPQVTAVKTGAHTAADDEVVLCDTSGGVFTVTLPASVADLRIVVKLVTAGSDLTIDGDSAELIDGTATITLNVAGQSRTLIGDGTGWHII